LVHYFSGWVLHQAGRKEEALAAFCRAAALPPGTSFPNQLESVLALQTAQRLNPGDAYAPYLLGNFWYAHHRYSEAMQAWETASELDPTFPTAWRNLGLAYFNKLADPERARQVYETAHHLAPGDARIFFELDQLYKKLNLPPDVRLSHLTARPDLVDARDDLTIEYINLLLVLNRQEEALEILTRRKFYPWEGGEGKVTGAYVDCLVECARIAIQQGDPSAAVVFLERARLYPPNLGEGKLYGALENHILYYLGESYSALGQKERAKDWFMRASIGLSEPTSAMFYNDQPPHMIFYQGLALSKLGREADAKAIFTRLVQYGQDHLSDTVQVDYFAVSLPDFLVFDEDLTLRNQIHCHYMTGLGRLGLGEIQKAAAAFDWVLSRNANHSGAHLHKRLLSN
ncbi:MAG: tetratricopeptide repeat protein, partial [Anaerolineaceae bacterium]|nr:tetratricopeptide repeat protein [Anaerolineaceae bacterium]